MRKISSTISLALRKLVFLLLLTGIGISASHAEENRKTGFDPKYALSDLALDVWTIYDNLASNNVNAIYQAKSDYLWITSYHGIQRFDGHHFELFDHNNVPFLTSNSFDKVAEDNQGNLWFCSETNGLIGYNGEDFTPFPLHDTLPRSILSVCIDSKNNFWIGSKNEGLFLVNEKGQLFKRMEIPDMSIHEIIEDKDGNIWVATDNAGIFKFTDQKVQNFNYDNGLYSNLASELFMANGEIFVGTINGLNVISEDAVLPIVAFAGMIINDLVVDDFGFIWVATEHGLVRYHREKNTMEWLSSADGLPDKRVVDLYFDNEGSLWVCTYAGGLARLKPAQISNLTTKNGLSTNKIHIIAKHENKYYLGTQEGTIDIYDGENTEFLYLKNEFSNNVIRDFLFEDDAIWVANYDGLVKIEGSKKTYINKENGLPDHTVRIIFKDSKGRIWLGTRTGGLIRYNKDGSYKIYDKNAGLYSNFILSINEDQNGNLLIGTNAGGLSILSSDHEWSHYTIQDEISGTLIFNILVDDENTTWLSTNLGLYRFLNGETHKVDFLPTPKMKEVYDAVADRTGNLWLSTAKGVIKASRTHINDAINGSQPGVGFELYGKEEGMNSQECIGATRSFYDHETNKIWIPTYDGIAIIDPERRVKNKKIPKVYITRVQIDNNAILPVNNYLKIKPGTFRYNFNVTALSYLAPSKIEFKYKLEGIDADWNGPTKDRRIEYTNLPYGDYTLQVQACNNDGVWNEKGAQLSFTILPFYFETWWFRAGMIVFLALLFWSLYTWKVYDIKKSNKRLRKMNSELDRFVYSASHDFRGPLTTGMGLVNLAVKEEDLVQKDEYIRLIKICIDKMNHFISELISYAKNKNDHLEFREIHIQSLIESTWESLQEQNTHRHVVLEYGLNGVEGFVTDETRIQVILRNLMHNAIIFSDPEKSNKYIRVSAQRQAKTLELSVADNGIGVAKSSVEKIFDMFYRASDQSIGSGLGLYVVKETIEKLDAAIEVKTEEGKGSTFIVKIPLSKN